MTDHMTPTEQDKLREQIHKLLGDYQADDGGYQSCYDGKWIDMTNEVCAVADFITADRKRVELEARTDELQKALDENAPFGEGQLDVAAEYVEYRLAELKAQQEEV